MAAYQARQRDPLLDSNTQAILERRGKELLGFGFIVTGILVSLLLASYAPEDPSWMAATDEPAKNILGRLGASIASPLYIIAGLGSWAIAAVLLAWGARYVAHYGEERAISRGIFAPIGVAVASIYASTHAPGLDWSHSFGLGGLFGDTVLGAVLGTLPIQAALGLKVLSFMMAGLMLAVAAFVLGFTWKELRSIGRFMLLGMIMIYALTVSGAIKLARWTVTGIVSLKNVIQERQARTAESAQEVAHNFEPMVGKIAPPMVHRSSAELASPVTMPLRAEPSVTAPTFAGFEESIEEPKTSLLARINPLRKKQVEEDLPEPMLSTDENFGDPRIKAKIADAMRNRMRQVSVLKAAPEEPVVTAMPAAGWENAAPMAMEDLMPIADPYALVEEYDSDGDIDMAQFEATPPQRAPHVAPIPDPKKVVQHPPRKAVQPSRRAQKEAQPTLQFDSNKVEYEHPPLGLLSSPQVIERHMLSDEALEENARMLESVLDDYGVKGEIVSVRPGPVVTMYELEPAPGLKASRVIGLADDIARSMSALSARVSTVPGRSVIGIELPNVHREKVVLREILAARDFGDSNMRLPLALGKDIGGDPIVANLAKMPHLLIAGTTGSGKSVAINTMILSLLYKLSPEDCRMIMIDPKMLELSVYDGIPHLLSPVVTDPKKAVVALKWVVGEMEERYRKMSKMGVRNIEGYNGRVRDALDKGELFSRTVQTGFDDDSGDPIFETEETTPVKIPYIVVVVDEMADLMMVAGKEIEACIQRLAQMARASGIHLIMATQRPSVDVITGTIKANFPTRISFQVTSKIDSRTILGEMGAEQLLGMGDMLYMAGGAKITRVHGPFVSDEEVEEIVNHLKSFGPPEYMHGVTDGPDEGTESSIDLVLGLGGNTDNQDALYDEAVQIVINDRKCSTSYIQRKLAIGYNKAARLVEQMEDSGLVSAANHVGKREILVPEQ